MTDIKTTADQFDQKSLPKAAWTHLAHIAVAFVALDTLKDFDKTLRSLRDKIKVYNLSVGTQNTDNSGYHETLTVFWLTVVNEFYTANRWDNLNDMYERFRQTVPASSKFPALFYSHERLFSMEARHHWTSPDLLPIAYAKEMVSKGLEPHFLLTDEAFEAQFAASVLDPQLFSHEAHIRLAWIHIKQYGEAKAIQNITEQLQNFVKHVGATDKYNETLTIAAIKAVKHFMDKVPIDTFYAFIATHPRLKTNFKHLIEQHYSFDIFNSVGAKAKYLEPDLLAFA